MTRDTATQPSAPAGMVPAPQPEITRRWAYDVARDTLTEWETALFARHPGAPPVLFCRLPDTGDWWPAYDRDMFVAERDCLVSMLTRLEHLAAADAVEIEQRTAALDEHRRQIGRIAARVREMDAEVSK